MVKGVRMIIIHEAEKEVHDGRETRIILVKNTDRGTILFEEVLFGKRNRALNAKSLIIKKGIITEESLRNILASNAKNDITNMKIRYADAVVAKSTIHSV